MTITRNNVNTNYENYLKIAIAKLSAEATFVPTWSEASSSFRTMVKSNMSHPEFRTALRIWAGAYHVTDLNMVLGKIAPKVIKKLAEEGYEFNPSWIRVSKEVWLTSILIKKEDYNMV